MKEMHKWKDKVELSLDNRQIFFLFFGASVVGCFVFGLGMMVGRRVDLDLEGQGVSEPRDSLALLEAEHQASDPPLSFKEGLRTPATIGLPQTRSEEAATAPEVARVEAPQAAAPEPAKVAEPELALPEVVEAPPEPRRQRPVAAVNAAPPPKPAAPRAAAAPRPTVALAAAQAPRDEASNPAAAGRKFTLQMKAFSQQDEADAFAASLRARGHGARVESHEVKGRLWYRVRVGEFETWAEGLSAKEAFEQREKIIAYVVRQ